MIQGILAEALKEQPQSLEELSDKLKQLSVAKDVKVGAADKAHTAAVGTLTGGVAEVQRRKAAVTQGIRSRMGPPEEVAKPATIEERMAQYSIPGIRVAVINDGELEWSQGFGNLDDASTEIQAGSISKTIAAMAILALVGEKGLDADVGDVFREKEPELWKTINPHGYPVTVRALLSPYSRSHFRDRADRVLRLFAGREGSNIK